MNKKLYYSKLIEVTQKLIGIPQTGPEEDKSLRAVLNLLTKLRDESEEVAPLYQPTPPPAIPEPVAPTAAQEFKQGGAY